MGKAFGIDLGTTYSCIAYVDENGKPVVLKNSEGNLTTPSVVWFEGAEQVTVGDAAKESATLYPNDVISFVKRTIGQAGAKYTANGVEMSPEEVSSYTLRKVVGDAIETLRSENKLSADETITDVVITCPAYFGIAEREATKKAGEIAGLNVLDIINEPTAAAIAYGVTEIDNEKTVMVYDLGGGTFDVTIISIKPGQIKVVCTGGNHNLGGKNWDEAVLNYLDSEFQSQTGLDTSVTEDLETLQELNLSVERAKKFLTAKDKAPITINFQGEKVRVELTREKFDELTEDLLESTIALTNDVIAEANKKGVTLDMIDDILLVGGSTKMPQVARRVEEAFGKKPQAFDPDESVAKGAAIYASKMAYYQKLIEIMSAQTGKTQEEIEEEINDGKISTQQMENAVRVSGKADELDDFAGLSAAISKIEIINVTSRSFGNVALNDNDKDALFNLIFKNDELPAECTKSFYTVRDNQNKVRLTVMESLSTDDEVDVSLGKKVGEAMLTIPDGLPRGTEIQVTFKLNKSGLLELHACEPNSRMSVDAEFQTTDAISEQELDEAKKRNANSNVG